VGIKSRGSRNLQESIAVNQAGDDNVPNRVGSQVDGIGSDSAYIQHVESAGDDDKLGVRSLRKKGVKNDSVFGEQQD
jgi:hypothetical protein